MSRSEGDRLKPPRAGEPISARYLAQEHRRNRRNRVVVAPPLFSFEGPGGIVIGLAGAAGLSLLVAVSTSTISAATRSGTTVTAFGTGTANLCQARSAGGCEPNADKGVDVQSLGTGSIASGTMVLLAELPSIGPGYFVIGRIC